MYHHHLKSLIINSLFAVIIAILAQISIPIGPIPLTGQTFATALAATILGAKNSCLAISFYILLGTLGIPVFQGMAGGPGVLLGPTGGFIIGFIFNGLITGFIIQQTHYKLPFALLANIIGMLVTLFCGSMWLIISTHLPPSKVFLTSFLPFLLPGFIKAVLASYLGLIIRNRLISAKLLFSQD